MRQHTYLLLAFIFLLFFSAGKVYAFDLYPKAQPFTYSIITPFITPLPSPTPTLPVLLRPKVTKPKPNSIPQSAYDGLFAQYAKEFRVDAVLLKKIAQCESGMNPNAVNGLYAGLFQFHPNTWMNDRKIRGWDSNPELRFNPEEAIKTAAAKIASGGISAWPVCGR